MLSHPAFDPADAAQPVGAVPSDAGLARCLALMLDEIDHGLLLLAAQDSVRLLNHRARCELDAQHPLQLQGGRIRARLPLDQLALMDALLAAGQRGTRRLLTLGDKGQCVSVAVVPLPPDALDGGPATMLLLGKRMVGEELAVQAFARSHRLTPAEARVLGLLCAGVQPAEVAQRQSVRLSTVRTQIGCLREKTGARSIRALVRMVAMLPPMVPALRGEAAQATQATQATPAPSLTGTPDLVGPAM